MCSAACTRRGVFQQHGPRWNELHPFRWRAWRTLRGVRSIVEEIGRRQGDEVLTLTEAETSRLQVGETSPNSGFGRFLEQFDGRTVSAESVVDRGDERVDFRAVATEPASTTDLPFVVDQIADGRSDPLLERLQERCQQASALAEVSPSCSGDESGRRRDKARGIGLAMIRHAAGEGVAVFERRRGGSCPPPWLSFARCLVKAA
jgi:hypothetical protein